MTMKYILCFAILAVSLRNVRARFSSETQLALMEYTRGFLDECAKEFNLNVDQFKEQLSPLDKLDDTEKCLFACSLKKKGILNEEGKFDVDKTLQILMGIIKNSDDYKTLETLGKSCATVNDEKVSDGVKGCDRTFLLISCVMKNSEKLF